MSAEADSHPDPRRRASWRARGTADIEKRITEKGETMAEQQAEFTTLVYWRAGPRESWAKAASVDEPIMGALAEVEDRIDFANEQAIGRELLLIEQNSERYVTAVLTARVEAGGVRVVIA